MRIHTLMLAGLAVTAAGCGDENAHTSAKLSNVSRTPAASGTTTGQMVDAVVTPGHTPATQSDSSQHSKYAGDWICADCSGNSVAVMEQRFIRQNALSIEDAGQAMKSAHFDQVVNALERDAARDRDAQEVSTLYRAEVAKAMPVDGRLVNIACGLSVCMGSVRAPSKASLSQWSSKFGESKRAPSHSQIDYTKQIGPHEYESRFMFSTDPGADSLSGRLPVGR